MYLPKIYASLTSNESDRIVHSLTPLITFGILCTSVGSFFSSNLGRDRLCADITFRGERSEYVFFRYGGIRTPTASVALCLESTGVNGGDSDLT